MLLSNHPFVQTYPQLHHRIEEKMDDDDFKFLMAEYAQIEQCLKSTMEHAQMRPEDQAYLENKLERFGAMLVSILSSNQFTLFTQVN